MNKTKSNKYSSTKGRSAAKTVFACQDCGAQRHRWEGRCSDCGAWNSIVEGLATASVSVGTRGWIQGQTSEINTLDQDPGEMQLKRWGTGLTELDRVLGGGLVKGSFVLLGGAPGKKTKSDGQFFKPQLKQQVQGDLNVSRE